MASVRFTGSNLLNRTVGDLADSTALGRAERLASIGQLAAGLAHEMNTPLGSVSAHAEESLEIIDRLQRESAASAPLAELRSHQLAIMRQAHRCSRVASRMLLFVQSARPVSGKCRSDEVVHDVIQLFATAAEAKGVRLEQQVTSRLPDVFIGPSELEQLLVNLVQNSLDACGRGDTVRLQAEAQDDHAEFVVEDTGCGIPKGDLNRIFEPFFTTKPVGQGTGLGLSVCLGIVRSARGAIEVESTPGAGTRVRVTLPAEHRLACHAAAAEMEQCDASPKRYTTAQEAGGQRCCRD
jgi:two-component system NtrC family sensor kinase